MYSGGKKHKSSSSYLARPRLGTLKGFYSGKPLSRPLSGYGSDKKKKIKKSAVPKMDFRRKPDYADTAYREAVSRLRILLAESYTPIKRSYTFKELDSAGEETDNQSLISGASRTSPYRPAYYYTSPGLRRYPYFTSTPRGTLSVPPKDNKTVEEPPPKYESHPPELMSFIQRQEDYIEQLEKEQRFCRDELATLLDKVKEVISENESLHERQKSHLLKSVFDHLETETETETEVDLANNNTLKSKPTKSFKQKRVLEGPNIVFESRISELEAQLTQTKIDLRKAQDENETLRRKISDGTIMDGVGFDTFKKQVDTLQREKNTLQDTVSKLQIALTQLRNKENDTCDQVKRSLDVAEQVSYEKSALEMEVRRLKDELERQHSKLREAITEQSRKVADERNSIERRYSQQIEQLTAELGVQWENTSKLQLELDKTRRENGDLRRELAQKQSLIDELKKEMQNKIASNISASMQADLGVSSAEKSALEHQIASLQLANERNERQNKQEISRLQAEMQSLRQRLDRADADLIHSRRENIRLNEQVASLEKEVNLNAAIAEERNKRKEAAALPAPRKEEDLPPIIKEMEAKHAATVAELEGMIHSQNQLMDKLSFECHVLTQKLEESSNRHKEEIRELHTNLDNLTSRFTLSQTQQNCPEDQDKDRISASSQRPTTTTTVNPHTANQHKTLSRTSSSASVNKQSPLHGTIPQTFEGQEAPQEQNYAENPQAYNNYPQQETQGYLIDQPQQEFYDNTQYDPNVQYSTDQYDQYQQQYTEQTDPNYANQGQYGQYVTDPNGQYDSSEQQYHQQYGTDGSYTQQPSSGQAIAEEPGTGEEQQET